MSKRIKNNKKYKVKESLFFKKKYGTETPEIIIEDRDIEVFGAIWKMRMYVPAVVHFMMRQVKDKLHSKQNEKVYYGKIQTDGILLGELVFESELEEI